MAYLGLDLGMVSPNNFDQSESRLKDKIGHDTGDILDEKNEIHDFSLVSGDHVTVVMND